jgi:hypothetical protein
MLVLPFTPLRGIEFPISARYGTTTTVTPVRFTTIGTVNSRHLQRPVGSATTSEFRPFKTGYVACSYVAWRSATSYVLNICCNARQILYSCGYSTSFSLSSSGRHECTQAHNSWSRIFSKYSHNSLQHAVCGGSSTDSARTRLYNCHG